MKIGTWEFWGLWLRIDTQNSEIPCDGYNMADQNVKITWREWK